MYVLILQPDKQATTIYHLPLAVVWVHVMLSKQQSLIWLKIALWQVSKPS